MISDNTRGLRFVLAMTVGLTVILGGCATSQTSVANVCNVEDGQTLQILGSGGPIADDARAGSSYLVWDRGQSRVLVDAGGGSITRFGAANASFTALDVVALSHFHVDHSTDLPALLKSGYFANREAPLTISGPTGGGPFPDLETFLNGLIGKDGAYGYLSGYLDGTGDLPMLEQRAINPQAPAPTMVMRADGGRLELSALGVPHAIVPALAYRLDINGKSIVFAGDQNGNKEAFVDFARGADVLVMHLVVPEGITGAGRKLHAPPSRVGEIAAATGAKTLVLSHFMARSLRDLDRNVALVRQKYSGPVILAEDLMCVPF